MIKRLLLTSILAASAVGLPAQVSAQQQRQQPINLDVRAVQAGSMRIYDLNNNTPVFSYGNGSSDRFEMLIRSSIPLDSAQVIPRSGHKLSRDALQKQAGETAPVIYASELGGRNHTGDNYIGGTVIGFRNNTEVAREDFRMEFTTTPSLVTQRIPVRKDRDVPVVSPPAPEAPPCVCIPDTVVKTDTVYKEVPVTRYVPVVQAVPWLAFLDAGPAMRSSTGAAEERMYDYNGSFTGRKDTEFTGVGGMIEGRLAHKYVFAAGDTRYFKGDYERTSRALDGSREPSSAETTREEARIRGEVLARLPISETWGIMGGAGAEVEKSTYANTPREFVNHYNTWRVGVSRLSRVAPNTRNSSFAVTGSVGGNVAQEHDETFKTTGVAVPQVSAYYDVMNLAPKWDLGAAVHYGRFNTDGTNVNTDAPVEFTTETLNASLRSTIPVGTRNIVPHVKVGYDYAKTVGRNDTAVAFNQGTGWYGSVGITLRRP
jgi:hypothetical protein